MNDRYRGQTTRQRRLAEKVAREWAERRTAAEARERELDLDRASAEAEVELLDPAARAPAHGDASTTTATRRQRSPAARPSDRAGSPSRGAGRRVPDLAVLPRLLHGTGSFASLRERLGPAGDARPGCTAATPGLTAVPHGAKSYLAAALALAPDGERICWVARDAEIGDRVAEELQAWLGDPSLVAVLEPRTALAYERSELVADETAARVAALAAWRSGAARVLVASVQALVQATLAPDDLPTDIRTLRPGDADRARPAARRAARPGLHAGHRGRRPRRVRAPGRHRRRVPAERPPPDPHRAVRRRDRLAPGLRPDRPAQRRRRRARSRCCPRPSSSSRPAAPTRSARASARAAARLPERLAADLARFAGDEHARSAGRPAPPGGR